MLDRAKIFEILIDDKSPIRKHYNNGEILGIVDYIIEKYNKSSLEDGIYIETLAVKNGVRYNDKIIRGKDLTNILVSNLMNGVEEIWNGNK